MKWETSEFIWNFGLVQSSVNCPLDPGNYFSSSRSFNPDSCLNLKQDDIVWLRCVHIPEFCDLILPKLKVDITILIADGDASFPTDCGSASAFIKLINNKHIKHIYAQNCEIKHHKVSHIPIGIDYHTIAYSHGGWQETPATPKEQEAKLNSIIKSSLPTNKRKLKAFIDFQHADTMQGGEYNRQLQFGENRTQIFDKLRMFNAPIDHCSFLKRSELWKKKSEYAFSISPHGHGYDCHRTWEDLILGCIVIVKTSPLDVLYKDLAVIIVKDWSEITELNMQLWLSTFGDVLHNDKLRYKLKLDYWLHKIYEY